eukprot:jgi/Ulvmu1/844/UM010_0218.1
MNVLVTGGSGYLGQFAVQRLSSEHSVCSTWWSCPPPEDDSSSATVKHVQCDVSSVQAVQQLFDEHGPFDGVVNCAAISQPGACQQDPDRARALNIPTALLAALRAQRDARGLEATLVHVSTDQVYDGSRALWTEADSAAPVNAYGQSKLDAERAVRVQWPRHTILRSSIIYGPQSPVPVARPLFVQFVEEVLRTQKECKFFTDEFRSPILVHDLVSVIAFFLSSAAPSVACGEGVSAQAPADADGAAASVAATYNAGGPDRLSRMGIVEAVAQHCGYGMEAIEAAESASIVRAAPSPLDISMESGKLVGVLPFPLTPFADALEDLFPAWTEA